MQPTLDEDRSLAEALAGLANPVRLSVLRDLRTPKTLKEIRVPALEGQEPRPLSRQAIRPHLDQLLGIGAIVALSGERAYGDATEYMLDHRRLFALGEDLRALAALRPSEDRLPGRTNAFPDPHSSPRAGGPRLVMVHGLREGTIFPLEADEPGGTWLIGRSRAHAVCLDYDPFASTDNAVIRQGADGAFAVEDVPGSVNGTNVNFERLTGGPRRLEHGDVVGVGRTLLLFWSR